MPQKCRLDDLLIARGLAETRWKAERLVMAGQVRVGGQVAPLATVRVPADAELCVEQGPRYVSRGGEKLEAALRAFSIRVSERVCADVGASTGGFTDCLLQAGAARVYALDVGEGILAWKLRQDGRVVVMEGTNVRYVSSLPEAVSLVTMDASFISSKVLLPVVKNWLTAPGGEVVVLIKPQYEARRDQAARHKGVIRAVDVHRQVLLDVLDFAQQQGFAALGVIRSPLRGPKGNAEFLAHLLLGGQPSANLNALIASALLRENSPDR